MKVDHPLMAVAGLCGATGVALSAVAAHAGGPHVGTAASFLLFHASALLALSRFGENRTARIGGWLLVVGLVVFAGDLLARDYLGDRLFPFAAPLGGTALIAGWLVVAIAAILGWWTESGLTAR